MRRKSIRAKEQAELEALRAQVAASSEPNTGGEAPTDPIPAVREKA